MANVLKSSAASELIAKIYLNEQLADVHFVFEFDDDVQKVPAHKLILASLSPVFHTMFYGSLKEGNEVKIEDADANAFKEFLQFFYLGEVTLNMENIETIVRLADKYDVLEYVNACAVFLKTQLKLDNMFWGYQLAVNLKNDELIEFCEEQIARSPKKIFATDAFQRCDKNILKRILELDLTCKEINVFEACLTWAKHACEKDELDATQAANLRFQLGDSLRSIRFSAMTIEEFSAIEMSNDGLFTPDEFKDIMFTLTAKAYEPKIFKQNSRLYKWNESDILKCDRRISDRDSAKRLKSSESVWFTSNRMVLLGEIYSASTNGTNNKYNHRNFNHHNFNQHNLDYQQIDAVNVTIAEIGSDSSKKVLYEGTSRTWDFHSPSNQYRLKVVLRQPIMIKPQIMYEIHFSVLIDVSSFSYDGEWEPTVELSDGLKIQFHRNPFHMDYDTFSCGWIRSLSFNRL
ncbi:BTB/POZ domain-containing protein 6-B-like [Sitodiplosis mosellana]|uniref:BTB/POZ domain-containing protein 6-B-like n=1 Tax=Sitodiplosis mosellana TaxID=263140 RepID=UPI00244467C4|nr:BTB/POZ domain-containing protein 6-B-like [Sitodiplosis mosellana]